VKLHSRFSALAVPSLLVLVGCSSMISSLAPRLHDNAVAYDAAISDINDRVLLANIVRARDYVPLSLTDILARCCVRKRVSRGACRWSATSSAAKRSSSDTMFMLREEDKKQAKLKVAYGGENVASGSGSVRIADQVFNDRGLLVLSLLSELVNSAKLSSDIPVTQQLQVLP
jgi:hypothetical protein